MAVFNEQSQLARQHETTVDNSALKFDKGLKGFAQKQAAWRAGYDPRTGRKMTSGVGKFASGWVSSLNPVGSMVSDQYLQNQMKQTGGGQFGKEEKKEHRKQTFKSANIVGSTVLKAFGINVDGEEIAKKMGVDADTVEVNPDSPEGTTTGVDENGNEVSVAPKDDSVIDEYGNSVGGEQDDGGYNQEFKTVERETAGSMDREKPVLRNGGKIRFMGGGKFSYSKGGRFMYAEGDKIKKVKPTKSSSLSEVPVADADVDDVEVADADVVSAPVETSEEVLDVNRITAGISEIETGAEEKPYKTVNTWVKNPEYKPSQKGVKRTALEKRKSIKLKEWKENFEGKEGYNEPTPTFASGKFQIVPFWHQKSKLNKKGEKEALDYSHAENRPAIKRFAIKQGYDEFKGIGDKFVMRKFLKNPKLQEEYMQSLIVGQYQNDMNKSWAKPIVEKYGKNDTIALLHFAGSGNVKKHARDLKKDSNALFKTPGTGVNVEVSKYLEVYNKGQEKFDKNQNEVIQKNQGRFQFTERLDDDGNIINVPIGFDEETGIGNTSFKNPIVIKGKKGMKIKYFNGGKVNKYFSGGVTKGKFSHEENPLAVVDKDGNHTGMELTGEEGVFDKKAMNKIESLSSKGKFGALGKFVKAEMETWENTGGKALEGYNMEEDPDLDLGAEVGSLMSKKGKNRKEKREAFRLVVKEFEKLGFPFPETAAGQWAQESGYGESPAGKNNFFNIKYVESKAQKLRDRGINVTKSNDIKDQATGSVDGYMQFDTPADSLKGYIAFIEVNPRYKDALNASSEKEYLKEIKKAGYAEDENYVENTQSVINSNKVKTGADIGGTEEEQKLFDRIQNEEKYTSEAVGKLEAAYKNIKTVKLSEDKQKDLQITEGKIFDIATAIEKDELLIDYKDMAEQKAEYSRLIEKDVRLKGEIISNDVGRGNQLKTQVLPLINTTIKELEADYKLGVEKGGISKEDFDKNIAEIKDFKESTALLITNSESANKSFTAWKNAIDNSGYDNLYNKTLNEHRLNFDKAIQENNTVKLRNGIEHTKKKIEALQNKKNFYTESQGVAATDTDGWTKYDAERYTKLHADIDKQIETQNKNLEQTQSLFDSRNSAVEEVGQTMRDWEIANKRDDELLLYTSEETDLSLDFGKSWSDEQQAWADEKLKSIKEEEESEDLGGDEFDDIYDDELDKTNATEKDDAPVKLMSTEELSRYRKENFDTAKKTGIAGAIAKLGGVDGALSLIGMAAGYKAATAPVPQQKKSQEWIEQMQRTKDRMNLGLDANTKTMYQRNAERTYAYDAANIGRGATSGQSALGALGAASSRKYNADLQLASMDATAKEQHFGQYQSALVRDEGMTQDIWKRNQYDEASRRRDLKAGLIGQAVKNVRDNTMYEKSYGDGSMYSKLMRSKLLETKEITQSTQDAKLLAIGYTNEDLVNADAYEAEPEFDFNERIDGKKSIADRIEQLTSKFK